MFLWPINKSGYNTYINYPRLRRCAAVANKGYEEMNYNNENRNTTIDITLSHNQPSDIFRFLFNIYKTFL